MVYDPNELLDTSQFNSRTVFLNVYDLQQSELIQKINSITTANNSILVGGVFHAGVEVYGHEWNFGFTEVGTGVHSHTPRGHMCHTYRTTVPMGDTTLTEQEFQKLILRLREEWPGTRYSLLDCNCQHFCNELLKELGLRRIPGWIDRAARLGSFVNHTSIKVAEETQNAVQIVKRFSSDLEEQAKQIGTDDVQSQAKEAFSVLRRESTKAFDVAREQTTKIKDIITNADTSELAMRAQSETAQLAELAQVHAKELGELAQVHAQELGGRAQEIGGLAQEHFKNLGSSIWKLGQELGLQGEDDQTDEPVWRALDRYDDPSFIKAQELKEKAQEHVQALGTGLRRLTQNLQEKLPPLANPILVDAAQDQWFAISELFGQKEDVTSFNDRGTHGLVRAQEERFLSTSLLDDDDDDLITAAAAPSTSLLDAYPRQFAQSVAQPFQTQSGQTALTSKSHEKDPLFDDDDDEAPLDWVSSAGLAASGASSNQVVMQSVAPQTANATAHATGSVDLLTGD